MHLLPRVQLAHAQRAITGGHCAKQGPQWRGGLGHTLGEPRVDAPRVPGQPLQVGAQARAVALQRGEFDLVLRVQRQALGEPPIKSEARSTAARTCWRSQCNSGFSYSARAASAL